MSLEIAVSCLLQHLANALKTNAEENIESLYPFTADVEKQNQAMRF